MKLSRALRIMPLAAALATAGCFSAATPKVARVGDAERAREAGKGRGAERLAPQLFAAGDTELRLAREASARGESETADLHADRALAAYAHAGVLARLAVATEDLATASAERERLDELGRRHAALRATVEREAEDLERQLKVAREAELPAPSGRADPDREKARWVAAQSLVAEAKLLCSAARLVSESAPGLREAEAALKELEKRTDGGARGAGAKTSAPIDEAARLRAACLSALTRSRRASASRALDETDALLSELSEANAPKAPVSPSATKPTKRIPATPSRDERGVVVTMPASSTFEGDALTREAKDAVSDLGRVAAAHPAFAIQIALHDDGERPVASGERRGKAVADALVDAGASRARVRVELAGSKAPVVDPSSKDRAKNARVEVVFVPASTS